MGPFSRENVVAQWTALHAAHSHFEVLILAVRACNRVDKLLNLSSVLCIGLGNLGCIGEVHETLHFAILNRPNVHQRKIETLTCIVHRRAVTPYHDHFVTLGDEFVSFERVVFLSACQTSEKSFFHLVGSLILAGVIPDQKLWRHRE